MNSAAPPQMTSKGANGAVVGRHVVALPVATLLLALTELALFPGDSGKLSGQLLRLFPVQLGNLVWPVAAVLALLLGCSVLRKWAESRGASRLTVPVVAALGLGPYAWGLSRFTFSGPRVAELSFQPALVGGFFFLFSVAVAVTIGLFLHWEKKGNRPAVVVLFLGVLVCHGVNREVLPHEYEPLHGALSWCATLMAVLASLLALRESRSWSRRPLALVLIVALSALGAVGANSALAESEEQSWLVFGESPTSRFLTSRWGQKEDSVESTTAVEARPEKPAWKETAKSRHERAFRRKEQAPHIVIFSIDNLQADRVGAYGYTKNPTTPNMDRIAEGGALFRKAYTLYPGTRVFLSSLLTGRRLPSFRAHRMPRSYQQNSLTRLLKERGYRTLVKGVFELTSYREFDPAQYGIDTNLIRATSAQIRKSGTIPHIPLKTRYKKIERHLRAAAKEDQPAFVWLHMLRPHRFRGGFVHSKKFPFGKGLDARYDSSVAATDAWIPRLEQLLERHNPGDRPVVWVFMADHGAGMTRGKKSEVGKTLYNDQVHVPLIFVVPEMGARDIHLPVDSAVDVGATLLDLVGIEPPAEYDGVSLLPLLAGKEEPEWSDRLIPLAAGKWRGGIFQGHKFIERNGTASLHDLRRDPLERVNLAGKKKGLLKEIRARVRAEDRRFGAAYREGLPQRKKRKASPSEPKTK